MNNQQKTRTFVEKLATRLPIHEWFDESKRIVADFRHRVLRHHAEGIFLAATIFGPTITLSTGTVIPTRGIGEQHVSQAGGRPGRACGSSAIYEQQTDVGTRLHTANRSSVP